MGLKQFVEIPYDGILQVRDKSALIYYQPAFRLGTKKNFLQQQIMLEARKTAYSGMISSGTRKRMVKACTLLVQSAITEYIYNPVSKRHFYHKLGFLTLTISDPEHKLSGKEAYQKLLKPFLEWLRKTHGMTTYIWKAELQKNKQIHYHITTPTFIHWQQVRDKWNNLQRSHGLLDRYYKTTGHYNANSTDIHKVKSIKNLSSYLVKYITKQYQNETSLGGKVWDCSNNLRGAKYFNCLFNDNHKLFIKYAVDSKLATEYIDERFTLIKFKEDVQEFILDETELKNYYSFMEIIRDKPSSTINF